MHPRIRLQKEGGRREKLKQSRMLVFHTSDFSCGRWKLCWDINEHKWHMVGLNIASTYLVAGQIHLQDKYPLLLLFMQCICLWMNWIWWMLANESSWVYYWLNVPAFAFVHALYVSMHFAYDHGGQNPGYRVRMYLN